MVQARGALEMGRDLKNDFSKVEFAHKKMHPFQVCSLKNFGTPPQGKCMAGVK